MKSKNLMETGYAAGEFESLMFHIERGKEKIKGFLLYPRENLSLLVTIEAVDWPLGEKNDGIIGSYHPCKVCGRFIANDSDTDVCGKECYEKLGLAEEER